MNDSSLATSSWSCRDRPLSLKRALVMGILNVTPDSFFDGGAYLDVDAAVARGEQMVADGADLLDIGGESTRPGATPVEPAEELRRVLPVLRRLRERVQVPLSLDTRHAEVALAGLDTGVDIINDVAANRTDPTLWQHVARHRAGYVLMHMQGTPATMQKAPSYLNVVAEIQSFFRDRLALLAAHGVAGEQVLLDPGIGFGKSLEHNLTLLRSEALFAQSGRPVMLGVSRKSFLEKLPGVGGNERLSAGLACTLWCEQLGARVFRTHDVGETVRALRMWATLVHPGVSDDAPDSRLGRG